MVVWCGAMVVHNKLPKRGRDGRKNAGGEECLYELVLSGLDSLVVGLHHL